MKVTRVLASIFVLLMTAVFITVNLATDIAYVFLDPRLRRTAHA